MFNETWLEAAKERKPKVTPDKLERKGKTNPKKATTANRVKFALLLFVSLSSEF